MRRHCKTVQEKVRAHACPYCEGVAFGTKSNLTVHIYRHGAFRAARRDHACPFCPGVAFGHKRAA